MSAPNPASTTAAAPGARGWPSVRDWPLEGLGDTEGALARRAAGLREYAQAVAEAPGLRESSWSGTASDAARALAGAHARHTASLADGAQAALAGLREYRAGAEALRARARELDAAARSHGMSIGEDGSASSAEGSLKGMYAKSVAQKLAAQASDVLTQATALDRAFAEVLAGAQWAEGKAKGVLERVVEYGGKLTPEQLQAVLKQKATDNAQFLGLTNPPVDPDSAIGRQTQFALEHPGAADARMNELAGELSGLEGKDLSLQDVYGQLAQFYPDTGKFHLAAGQNAPAADTPPRAFKDVIAEPWSTAVPPGTDPARAPNIAVRAITGEDGSKSYILNIGGQRVDNTPDQAASTDLNDMGVTNRALAGQDNWYQNAAEQALRAAGATPTDPVLISGISQGGIVAADAAADWVKEGKFNVTDVITEAAPAALAKIPSTVNVLSLENRYDIVPQFDGLPNPVASNWTTLDFSNQTGSVLGNHSNPGYVTAQNTLSDPGSAINQTPRVLAFQQSLAKNGFTTGASVQTTSYLATRDLGANAGQA